MRPKRDHIVELMRDNEVLQRCIIRNKRDREKLIYRWGHLYGKRYKFLLLIEYMEPKKYQKTRIDRPGRKLKLFSMKVKKVEQKEIDFGTGKLYYSIEPESTILLTELMQALSDAAMVVPLQNLVNAIKGKASRF